MNIFNVSRGLLKAKAKRRRTTIILGSGVDVILANACFLRDEQVAYFDFSTALAIDVAEAKTAGAFESFARFFELLDRYCDKNERPNNPVAGFNDSIGVRLGKKALKDMLLSLLPKGIQKGFKSAFFFATTDIGKQGSLSQR